jgi:hypothetical protein
MIVVREDAWASRLDPDVAGLGVGLPLEPRDEPPHLVTELAQEERHLRMRTRRLVDEVRREEHGEIRQERPEPRDQPPPIHGQHLAAVPRERP